MLPCSSYLCSCTLGAFNGDQSRLYIDQLNTVRLVHGSCHSIRRFLSKCDQRTCNFVLYTDEGLTCYRDSSEIMNISYFLCEM